MSAQSGEADNMKRFNIVKHCRYGLMMFNQHDWAIGLHLREFGEWAESEMAMLRPLIAPGHVVIDVGANIGAHTLFFARCVGEEGHVHAFEPQRVIFQTLCGNIAINSLMNVTCHPYGVGAQFKTLSVQPINYCDVNNSGMAKLGQDTAGESVIVQTLDSLSLHRCDLIKVDVEGMEKEVLQGAFRTIHTFRPVLYLENNQPDKAEALISYIYSLGYKIYQHMAPVYNPNNFLNNPQAIHADYLESNILCIPNEKSHAYSVDLPELNYSAC